MPQLVELIAVVLLAGGPTPCAVALPEASARAATEHAAAVGGGDALRTLQQSPWACAGMTGVDDSLEAGELFDCLARRYRDLHNYRDVTQAVCESSGDEDEGDEARGHDRGGASRIELRLDCRIDEGKLTMDSPPQQMRRLMGLDVPVALPRRLQQAWDRYRLWLAPHMMMHESDQPLHDMLPRGGEDRPLEAMRIASVTIDERPMVHLQLKSSRSKVAADRQPAPVAGQDGADGVAPTSVDAGDHDVVDPARIGQGASARDEAKPDQLQDPAGDEDEDSFIDLFVNPHSMLIERVESRCTLPDGRTWRTRLDITPREGDELPSADDEEVLPAPGNDESRDGEPTSRPVHPATRGGGPVAALLGPA